MRRSAGKLFDEVRLLWNLLVQTGERLHADERITMAMRAILEFLVLRAPATVPEIARARYVTRLHIQEVVNTLAERGLVEMADNRAPPLRLTRLTPMGKKTIERIRRREQRVYRKLELGVRPSDLERSVRTLHSLRNVLAELDAGFGARVANASFERRSVSGGFPS
jgi:DNA-binding MarR family transcriptional regulator